MANKHLNGLESDEIVMFYNFIVKTKDIGSKEKSTKINQNFPKTSKWEDAIDRKRIEFVDKTDDLNEVQINPISKLVISSSGRTQLNALTCHLRKSLIEGKIKRKDNYYIFDSSSILGEIPVENIKSFVKLFID